jgi:hypothetical protein
VVATACSVTIEHRNDFFATVAKDLDLHDTGVGEVVLKSGFDCREREVMERGGA